MKNKFIIWFFLFVFITFVLYFLILTTLLDTWDNRGTFGDMFGAINALFTALTLSGVVYSIYYQQKESSLRIRPIIVVEPKKEKDKFCILISNIGHGPALNIEFQPLKLADSGILFKANRITALAAGDSKLLEIFSSFNNERLDDFNWTAHLDNEYANRSFNASIIYEDIENQKYKTSFILGLGEMEVLITKIK